MSIPTIKNRVRHNILDSRALLPWLHTAALYLVYIVSGMYLASMGPSINDLSAQNGVDVDYFSSIFIIRTLGALVGSLFGARFYDRVSAKVLLIFMLSVCIIFFVSIPLFSLFLLTASVFFILGFSYIMLNAGGNIVITRVHGTRSAPFLSGLHFSFGIGAFLIPLVIAQIRLRTGTAVYAYWFIAAAALLVALFISILPAPPAGNSTAEHIHRHTSWSFIAVCVLFFFFFVGVEIAFGAWIYNYALFRGVADEESAAYLTSLFYGVYTATRFVAIPFAAKIDNKKLLLIFQSGALLVFIVLYFSPALPWFIFGATACTGFFLAPVVPLTLALIGTKSGLTGKITGLLQVGMVLGGAFFAWITGQLLTPAAHIAFPLILGMSMAAALSMGIVLASFKAEH